MILRDDVAYDGNVKYSERTGLKMQLSGKT